MEKLKYLQLKKDNEEHFALARSLWIPFIKEVNSNDGIVQTEFQIEDGLKKRISIQGSRESMHFEIAFLDNVPIGISMFAIDLGTVYGMLERNYGTVMGFYIHPKYRRMGLGAQFWEHIEETLHSDGAKKYYVCPDSITGLPFWKKMGFNNSGLFDPDDKKEIYIK